MKTGSSALIVAIGLLLLWIVTSGKTKNLASAWQTLVQSGGATSSPLGSVPGLPSLPSLGSFGTSLFPGAGTTAQQPGSYFNQLQYPFGSSVPSSAGPTIGVPQGPWSEQWPTGSFQIPAPGNGG